MTALDRVKNLDYKLVCGAETDKDRTYKAPNGVTKEVGDFDDGDQYFVPIPVAQDERVCLELTESGKVELLVGYDSGCGMTGCDLLPVLVWLIKEFPELIAQAAELAAVPAPVEGKS